MGCCAGQPPIDWLDEGQVAQVKAALATREVFPEPGVLTPEAMTLVQTHISSVILTPAMAFKFKRPVDVGFADFTTLWRRRRFCHAEVRLNRRLAPDVYLGVVPLVRRQGRLILGGGGLGHGGQVVDYAVVMRRLPAEAMLDQRLAQGQVAPQDMERLAALLTGFFKAAPAGIFQQRYGGLGTLRKNWEENFAQADPYVGRTLSAQTQAFLRQAVGDFLDQNHRLFTRRVADGRVVNGHGDLRCEHIQLGPPVKIIDCVEFLARFRLGDAANDLAFLLMDLVHLGRPDLARLLLEATLALDPDPTLARVLPFYACYRAYVRGKVTNFRLLDTRLRPEELARFAQEAAGFFQLAERFAHSFDPPVLLVVAGLMGSGKSSLAQALAQQTGLAVIATDKVRKELAATALTQGGAATAHQAAWGEGIYTPAWNDTTYGEVLARARRSLLGGRSVIVEGNFGQVARRAQARQLAQEMGALCLFVECALDEEETLRRLAVRYAQAQDPSDGRPELLPRQKAAWQPLDDIPPGQRQRINTRQSPQLAAAQVLHWPALKLPRWVF